MREENDLRFGIQALDQGRAGHPAAQTAASPHERCIRRGLTSGLLVIEEFLRSIHKAASGVGQSEQRSTFSRGLLLAQCLLKGLLSVSDEILIPSRIDKN